MGAEEFFPLRKSLSALREAAAGCRGCSLHRNATRTVFVAVARRLREAS